MMSKPPSSVSCPHMTAQLAMMSKPPFLVSCQHVTAQLAMSALGLKYGQSSSSAKARKVLKAQMCSAKAHKF